MAKDTITIRKQDLWKYSTFALAGLLVVFVLVFVFNSNRGVTGQVVNVQGSAGQAPSVAPRAPSQPSVVQASADDDPVLGDPNAPVTMIEFSDFQCPFCRKFWTETLPSIKRDYIDTGKVKFVYRDFPLLSLHPQADRFAEAAECVRDKYGEEAFWKAHDEIFAQQNILDSGSREGPVRSTARFTIEDVKQWLKDIGYNVDECVDSRKFQSEVQKDLADAQAAGGRGTPYFVINGKPVSGAQPYAVFKQIIDAELARN